MAAMQSRKQVYDDAAAKRRMYYDELTDYIVTLPEDSRNLWIKMEKIKGASTAEFKDLTMRFFSSLTPKQSDNLLDRINKIVIVDRQIAELREGQDRDMRTYAMLAQDYDSAVAEENTRRQSGMWAAMFMMKSQQAQAAAIQQRNQMNQLNHNLQMINQQLMNMR